MKFERTSPSPAPKSRETAGGKSPKKDIPVEATPEPEPETKKEEPAKKADEDKKEQPAATNSKK